IQPLFELVQDNQDLVAVWGRYCGLPLNRFRRPGILPAAVAQRAQAFLQAQISRQCRPLFSQCSQETSLRVPRGGLDVDGTHVAGQPRQQTGLDQRRLAATRWPVQESHSEGALGVPLLNASFPEANAVGQSIAVAWTRQQLEEEIGVSSFKS